MSNIMLVGGSGTGKTSAILSMPTDRDCIVIATDVSTLPTLKMWSKMKKTAPGKVPAPFVNDLCTNGGTIHVAEYFHSDQMSLSDLAKYTIRGKTELQIGRPLFDMISAIANFRCPQCSKEIGDLEKADENGKYRIVVCDGASGLNDLAMLQETQGKSTKTISNWGDAMDNEFEIIKKLCTMRTPFVLITHLQKMQDEVTGQVLLFPDFLGQKLGPRIPRFFNDVVQAVREGSKFKWSNMSYVSDLRSGVIPLSSDITPDFSDYIGGE